MGAQRKAGHDFTEEMNRDLALEGRVGVFSEKLSGQDYYMSRRRDKEGWRNCKHFRELLAVCLGDELSNE